MTRSGPGGNIEPLLKRLDKRFIHERVRSPYILAERLFVVKRRLELTDEALSPEDCEIDLLLDNSWLGAALAHLGPRSQNSVGYSETKVRKLLEKAQMIWLGRDNSTGISLWASADPASRLRFTAQGEDPEFVTWSVQ